MHTINDIIRHPAHLTAHITLHQVPFLDEISQNSFVVATSSASIFEVFNQVPIFIKSFASYNPFRCPVMYFAIQWFQQHFPFSLARVQEDEHKSFLIVRSIISKTSMSFSRHNYGFYIFILCTKGLLGLIPNFPLLVQGIIRSYCRLKIVSHFSSIFLKPRIPSLCVGEARAVSVRLTILISFEQMRSPVR